MNNRVIWIGNDHGGYEMKVQLVTFLQEREYEVVDVGCHSTDIVRYPYYAAQVAGAVSRGEIQRGILICSTGIGMSIFANKFKGVRASLCTSTLLAKMTRAHNDSNLLCLGGKCTGTWEALDILETWLNTEFEGGRHCISLDLIQRAEADMSQGELWQPAIPDQQ